MQKSIVITGSRLSGKTAKVKEIAGQFQSDEVVFIKYQGEHKNNFLFSQCTEKTKLIVFDDLTDIEQMTEFYNMVTSPITVHRKLQESFTISPLFVFVYEKYITTELFNKLGESFQRRFDVFQLTEE